MFLLYWEVYVFMELAVDLWNEDLHWFSWKRTLFRTWRKLLIKTSHVWRKELQLGNGEKTIDLTEIKKVLLQDEKLKSSRIQTSLPVKVTNSSLSINTSNISENTFDLDFLSLQDEDLVNIPEELQNRMEVSGNNTTENTSSNRLKGHFCSDTIFKLSHRVLSDAEIKILEKRLDFAPI